MTQEPSWRAIGQSVRGASHDRAGLPNQDSLCCWPPSQSGPPLILVVSDGHGSAKSFRSDRGSRFAVHVTAALLQELIEGRVASHNLSAIKRLAEERLPQELVRRWQKTVDDDLRKNPFTDDELMKLRDERGEGAHRDVLGNPRLAYGATVLGVLVERDFLLYLQLGDGDILTVADSGEVVRPIERDSRLMANETTSLCMNRAWREIRLRFQARYGGPPSLILAATDGYANSFVSDAAFLQVGSDILEILQNDGPALVQDSLEGWLKQASKDGSGDDITLGIVYCVDALLQPAVAGVARTATSGDPSNALDDIAESEKSQGHESSSSELGDAEVVPAAGDGEVPTSVDTPLSDQTASQVTDKESQQRSQVVAHLKHLGPSEPSKHGKLSDFIDGGDDIPLD